MRPEQKPIARAKVAALLDVPSNRRWSFFVRPNPLDNGMLEGDLAAVVKPD